MGLKRYGTDGAWCEVENVRRYAAGAGWQDAEFVRRWDGTKWADCWNRFDPTAIWRAAELLYGVSRNRNSTGNVSIPGYALTNPCYTFCFCATTVTIYRWDGSELTRIYNNNTDYRAFLSGRHRDGCHYLCASAMEGSTTNSGQVYGGAIAVFSFPGIKTETLDEMFAGTTVRASSGNNQSSSPGNPSIGSGSFSDGDFVLVSMRGIGGTYTSDNFNFAVNQRTGANTFRTLFVSSANNHPSCLSISNGSGGYVWANGIEPTYNPPKNGTVVALSWGV